MNKYLFWRFSQESILFSKYNNTMVFFLVLLQFLIQGQVLTEDGDYPKVWNKISLCCFHFPKLQEKIRKNKCPSICQQTAKRAFKESNVLLFNCTLRNLSSSFIFCPSLFLYLCRYQLSIPIKLLLDCVSVCHTF